MKLKLRRISTLLRSEIVRNLESKNDKMLESKEKLQVQVDVLNDSNTVLEGQLLERNEELLKAKKKENVAKKSIRIC